MCSEIQSHPSYPSTYSFEHSSLYIQKHWSVQNHSICTCISDAVFSTWKGELFKMMSLYLCSNQIELENKPHFQNATLSAHTYYEPDIMLIKSDVWRRCGNTMEPQPNQVLETFPESCLSCKSRTRSFFGCHVSLVSHSPDIVIALKWVAKKPFLLNNRGKIVNAKKVKLF